MPDPAVPNWIAKALIHTPDRSEGTLTPILSWRPTRTQVVVTVDGLRGPVERRFYLDTLTEVGQSKRSIHSSRLIAPDPPQAIASRRATAATRARNAVLSAVEEQRFQDYTDDAEVVAAKLVALRAAVNEALASLGEEL